MDITSVAAQAIQMKQAETAVQYAVAVAKKGLDAQKMMGEAVLKLIDSADVAARAQGRGTVVNLTA